ncbi:MAG: PQQ-binding-like beta-propeller repeat protein, partial [Armatimonadota bacterium]
GAMFNTIGDKVYVSSGSYITVLNLADGRKVWEASVPDSLAAAPGASEEFVVGVTRTGSLYAFTNTGHAVFKKGVDLGSTTRYAPVVSGTTATVATQVGTVTMVDIQSSEIKWNTVIRPASMVGQGNVGGVTPRGQAPTAAATKAVEYVQAAGAPILVGNSLFVLGKDGTLLSYDKANGVDLTPPEVRMLFPNPGDTISGRAPLSLIFRIDDLGVGVAVDTVKVIISDKSYPYKLNSEGYLEIQVTGAAAAPTIPDGRSKIHVIASDWLGNKIDKVFTLTIDNLLPPLGGPKKKAKPGAPTIPGMPPGMPPPGDGGDGGGDMGGGGGGGR